MSPTTTVIIFIPGTTATTLIDPSNGQDAWGGLSSEVRLDAAVNDDAAAEALLEGPLGIGTIAKLYNRLISFFQTKYGFTVTPIQSAADVPSSLAGHQFFTLSYDWRDDNAATAQILQTILQKIDDTFGSEPYQSWLLGHSMGGLVARATIEPSGSSVQNWFAKLQGLVTIATPHLGAPMALRAILDQLQNIPVLLPEDLDPVITAFVNYTGNNGAYDSTYELLPPPQVPFITDQLTGEQKSAFDLENQLVAAGAAQVNFNAAEAFFTNVLTYNDPTPKPYYCAFGISDGSNTTTGYTYDADTESIWAPVVTPQSGDGIVPASSAQFEGRTMAAIEEFEGVNHATIVQTPAVLQQVASWMNLAPVAEDHVA